MNQKFSGDCLRKQRDGRFPNVNACLHGRGRGVKNRQNPVYVRIKFVYDLFSKKKEENVGVNILLTVIKPVN